MTSIDLGMSSSGPIDSTNKLINRPIDSQFKLAQYEVGRIKVGRIGISG